VFIFPLAFGAEPGIPQETVETKWSESGLPVSILLVRN
jgi:hypothetical protein